MLTQGSKTLQQLLDEVLGHGLIVNIVYDGPFLEGHGREEFFSHKIPLPMLRVLSL
jgi:hypothetical protein